MNEAKLQPFLMSPLELQLITTVIIDDQVQWSSNSHYSYSVVIHPDLILSEIDQFCLPPHPPADS